MGPKPPPTTTITYKPQHPVSTLQEIGLHIFKLSKIPWNMGEIMKWEEERL